MSIINTINNFDIFFSIISSLIIVCAILVITNNNPIHSVLYLVLVFILTTLLLLILNVEFPSLLILVLYVGAIVILFLFVVMMLNIRIMELKERSINYLPLAIIITMLFMLLVLLVLKIDFIEQPSQVTTLQGIDLFLNETFLTSGGNTEIVNSNTVYQHSKKVDNTQTIAWSLYKDYVYLIYIAGLILFVAMIATITLTLRQKAMLKRQDYYKQTNKDIKKATRNLK